ncbi:MAG: hypothetical protein ACXV2C_07850 [Candidatus Bathyarchaeia archaeon]
MTVLDKLATSLNRNDEMPNQELAKQIVKENDKTAIKELVSNLNNLNKNIQSDCIKVLYEIGERKPSLIAEYADEFITLLTKNNNRLIWGAMTALDALTIENPTTIYQRLAKIIEAANEGSVITKDHAVNILIKLCSVKKYSNEAFALLIEQLKSCPTNQLPMYSENASKIINNKGKADVFINVLSSRLDQVEKESKKKRIEKVIKHLNILF